MLNNKHICDSFIAISRLYIFFIQSVISIYTCDYLFLVELLNYRFLPEHLDQIKNLKMKSFGMAILKDKTLWREIVDTTKTNLKGTSGKLNVFIDGDVNPVEIWTLNTENIYFRKSDLLSIRPELVISSNQTININKDNLSRPGIYFKQLSLMDMGSCSQFLLN